MTKLSRICVVNILLMIFSIIFLAVFDYLIGGNATNGKIENDIFYLMNSSGKLKECSKIIFVSNYICSCITAFFIILGSISIFICQIKLIRKLPNLMERIEK